MHNLIWANQKTESCVVCWQCIQSTAFDITFFPAFTRPSDVIAIILLLRWLQDIYLYYFLKQYPGRTLVFANSKDCIRRLVSILSLLQCRPLPLHADMHQRQRLKNLDKFTGNMNDVVKYSCAFLHALVYPKPWKVYW